MPSNLERKARHNRQTRLTFAAIGRPSSPTTGTLSPARVRYKVAGARRTPASSLQDAAEPSESDDVLSSAKKNDFSPAAQKMNGKPPLKALPTPAKSSQTQIQDDGASDSLEIEDDPKPSQNTRKTQRIARFMPATYSKRKQQTMGLDGANDSSDGSEPESYTPSKKNSASRKSATVLDLVSDSEDVIPLVVIPAKTPSAGPPTRVTRSSDSNKSQRQKSITISDTDDEILVPLSKKRRAEKHVLAAGAKSLSITPVQRKSRGRSKRVVDEDEESHNEDPILSSPKRSQRLTYQVEEDGEDEDEDEEVRSSPLRRRARQPFIEDEEEVETFMSPSKRRRSPTESEDSGDMDISPTKRRRPAVTSEESEDLSPTKRRYRSTQQNVDSGSEDLPSPSRIPRGRGRASESDTPQRTTRQQKQKKKHRTEREKKLELLRRKRTGEDIEQLTESESDSDSPEEDDFEQLEEFDDEEEEAPSVRKPDKGKQKAGTDGYNSDDFVIEDDEDADIGIPLAAIPLEFTHHAHKPLKDHFKDAVEWMVHNKINPGFARNDPIYKQAFLKLNDECYGLAKSKFSSTQWTRDFTTALYARPILIEEPLRPGEGFDMASGLPKCWACNHRKHKPSAVLIFQGKAYDKNTLEELDQSGSSDDSSSSGDSEEASDNNNEDDSKSVNSKGLPIPPETRRYAVGPVCKSNALQSHTLIHWKYNLNQWVIQALEGEGELTPEKLADREVMNLKKKTKYTNAVVDRWEASKQIKQLWHDYKQVTTTAREMTAKNRGGWQ